MDFSGKYILQTDLDMIMRKKTSLHGQGTNYPVHGLSQLLLVHNRKHQSKVRLDLGKNFPEPNLPSPQKGHDNGRANFARASFLDGYADHLELLPQTKGISISVCICMHMWEDCLPSEPFQSFKLYNQERFHLPDLHQYPHSIHIS